MARVLGFLIRYFSNYYTLHRSDLATRAAPLDPRLLLTIKYGMVQMTLSVVLLELSKELEITRNGKNK